MVRRHMATSLRYTVYIGHSSLKPFPTQLFWHLSSHKQMEYVYIQIQFVTLFSASVTHVCK